METYTYREALENVVGYLFNPIVNYPQTKDFVVSLT